MSHVSSSRLRTPGPSIALAVHGTWMPEHMLWLNALKKNSSLLDIPNNFSFMSEIKFILLSNVRMPYLKLMQSIKIGILKMRDEIIHF